MTFLKLALEKIPKGQEIQATIETRLAAIPPFPNLKKFNTLFSLANVRAWEWRHILRVICFVLEGLFEEKIVDYFADLAHHYFSMKRADSFSEESLTKIKTEMDTLGRDMRELFGVVKKNSSFPKFHMWFQHLIPSIRLFGHLDNFSTESFEKFHQKSVKGPWRMSRKSAKIQEYLAAKIERAEAISLAFPQIDRNDQGPSFQSDDKCSLGIFVLLGMIIFICIVVIYIYFIL